MGTKLDQEMHVEASKSLDAANIDHADVIALLQRERRIETAQPSAVPARKESRQKDDTIETWEIYDGGFLKEVWPNMKVAEVSTGCSFESPPGSKCRGDKVRC